MNFKFIILFIFFILAGCGVKNYPETPPGSQIPSYSEEFTKPLAPEDQVKK